MPCGESPLTKRDAPRCKSLLLLGTARYRYSVKYRTKTFYKLAKERCGRGSKELLHSAALL